MTVTANMHDCHRAEITFLGAQYESAALKFISSSGTFTLFVPPAVAEATANAFNAALSKETDE